LSNKQDDASTDLLIREVDEELRQEQWQTLWKRYGGLAIAGALALVVSVAGVQGWTAWQGKQRQEASERYTAALRLAEAGKTAEAADAFAALALKGTDGYQLLARFEQANLRVQAGDLSGAAALYDAIAADGGSDKIYRDFARLKAAYLRLDGGDAAAIQKSIDPLAAEASPWRHSARELMGLLALKQGDRDKAAEMFRKLADDGSAPQGVRGRAAELLAAAGGKTKG
jgi:hypothetical protein